MTATSAPEAAISVESLCKSFDGVHALRSVGLRVERGQFVSLLGPSGCGKTTLLRIVGGFETQTSGTVRIHGEAVDGRPPNKRPVNMVFQRYALFPHKTVGENIAFPLELQGVDKRERKERVAQMLELVRLPNIADRTPAQLSGGQAQRVAVARALVGRPEVLLLDEPLGALDLKLRKHMQLELRRIHEELGTTFVYVTHDQEEALTMSDRVVLMNEGQIVQDGAPREIYDAPNSVFASSFVGEVNLLRGTVATSDSGQSVVEVHGSQARVAGMAQIGEAVSIAIRPELIFLREGSSASGHNELSGCIARQVFLGNCIQLHVEVAPDVVVLVETSRRGTLPADGSEVVICWEQRHGVLIRATVSTQELEAMTSGDAGAP